MIMAATNERSNTVRQLAPQRNLSTVWAIVAWWIVHDIDRDGDARVTDVNASACVTTRTSDEFFNLRICLPTE